MDHLSADDVATLTKKAAAYGNQLAAVFHSFSLSAEKIPRGFEGAINVLDATIVTLNQVLNLLESEAEGVRNGNEKRHFSYGGLEYVKLLATEFAATLAKVVPIVTNACLNAKELKAKRRQEKRELAKNGPVSFDIGKLKLDEIAFLAVVENAKWSLAIVEIEECMDRLYDLQLHLLLVFQVVTVGAMSRDLSSGKVDVKSIVAFHDRINRTAELVGVKLPQSRSKNKRFGYDTSSESDSLFDSDNSDSDESSIQSFRYSDKTQMNESSTTERIDPPSFKRGAPPPPPANWPSGIPMGPRHTPPWQVPNCIPTPPTVATPPEIVVNPTNPPSYSESKPASPSGTPSGSSATSTLLGTVSQTSDAPTVEVTPSEKSNASQVSPFPEEKEQVKVAPTEKGEATSLSLEPRLFKSNTKGLRFKVKSVFRSNKSLAEEMKKVLSDADSTLTAVVIQAGIMRQVPHSAFHSLEATHMRTILSQINGDDWYNTFTKMDTTEHAALERLLRPFWVKGERYDRELVVLKVVHERKHAWAVVLRDILTKFPAPHSNNSRVLLAIIREKLFNGKPAPLYGVIGAPPPLPPPPPPHNWPSGPPPGPPPMNFPPFPPPNVVPAVRPPPGLPSPPVRITKTSDLRYGPQVVPQTPLGAALPIYGSPAAAQSLGRPEPPAGTAIESIRISDTTPLTDYDATLALTSYIEYTLRLTDALNPGVHPRSWSRVTVTQESAERHLIIQRVQTFQRVGGNVLEVSLRLTEQQSSQVTRLMDELKGNERDLRFEWCWVELSLYNNGGEITDFTSSGGFPKVASATMMHLIAKRMPKAHCKPLDLYNSLMRPLQPPMPVVNQAPVIVDLSRSPYRSRSRSRTRWGRRDSYSDLSSLNSLSSDESSVSYVRRKLRKCKAKKMARAKRGVDRYSSDSDAEESEDEDVIQIKLELKRGDDVIQSLLDIWTPQIEAKGKGKEKEKV